jgi:diguanylate cyclase (GGDEF)-like protein/PAS domain S-box-containing protein
MKIAPLPANEQERLEALRKYEILDTEPEEAFENMVKLATHICQTPIAAISLVDQNRQWFKAIAGLDAKETPRDVAFCAHAILQDDALVVPDALKDERFFDNPLVASAPDIRFYAGVPLVTSSGYHLGTLCVIDRIPRDLAKEQLDAIKVLADNVMAHLDLRLSHKRIRQYVDDLQLAAAIFESSSEAMMVTDADNRIITVNPAFVETTGYAISDVAGKDPSLLASGNHGRAFYDEMWQQLAAVGRWSGEVWNKRKNGELYAESLSINVIFNGDGSRRLYVAIFSDITEKKRAEELIWKHANYDHLTQLPNRRLFRDRLDQSIKLADRSRSSLALLFVDLDRFKAVNDTLGHDHGDELLVQAAERISRCVRKMDTVSRVGGDEFTVILSELDDSAHAGRVAQSIVQELTGTFVVGGSELNVSASIGIAAYPDDGDSSELLLKRADVAMYAAKESGDGRICYYNDAPKKTQ